MLIIIMVLTPDLVKDHHDHTLCVCAWPRCLRSERAGTSTLFWLRFETQATWLRDNKETSPVLVRPCLRRNVEPIQQNFPHACKGQIDALKILSKLPSASTTQELAAHVPSPSNHSPNSSLKLLGTPLLHLFTRDQRHSLDWSLSDLAWHDPAQLHQKTLRFLT